MEKAERTIRLEKIKSSLEKLKFPLLILLIGAVLMLLPGKKAAGESGSTKDFTEPTTAAYDCETRLEEILSQIQGAGKVKVMLTLAAGERTVYQQDSRTEQDTDDSGSSRRQEDTTVLISGGGSEEAVIAQVLGPTYQGAVVVCHGADQPQVKLAVVQAVCSVTGLGADQVTVLKMK